MQAKKKVEKPVLYHVTRNFCYELNGKSIRVNKTIQLNGEKDDPITLHANAIKFGESIDALKKA